MLILWWYFLSINYRRQILLMKIWSIAFLFILLSGCDVKREEFKNVLYWNNKTITFVPEMQLKVRGHDTLIPVYPNRKYKILVFVGPHGCTSCQLNLYAWQCLIDSLQLSHPETDVVFVVNVTDYKEFEYLAKINKFRHPVFYDTKGKFTRHNKMPLDKTVQVLFLKEDNKVVFAGNPLKNGKLIKNFYKLVSE